MGPGDELLLFGFGLAREVVSEFDLFDGLFEVVVERFARTVFGDEGLDLRDVGDRRGQRQVFRGEGANLQVAG